MHQHIGELFLKSWLHSKVATVKTKKESDRTTKRKFPSAHHGQTRSKTDSSLPNLGKQEVKLILPFPAWASKK